MTRNEVFAHCPNSYCNYSWRYMSKFAFYTTFPSCRRNIKVAENQINPQLQSVKVGRPSQTAVDSNTLVQGLSDGHG
ncbi:MAG: hypothetical protein ACTHKP_02245 [Nitrososphaeraceae archaeon]